MAIEPALPKPLVLVPPLRAARDDIVSEVDRWLAAYRETATIGHAGRVTPKFLHQQSGEGTRAIVTAFRGETGRLAGGGKTLCEVTWNWWLIISGTLEDRNNLALDLEGEAVKLVIRSPWSDIGGNAFAYKPKAGVLFENRYRDDDEGLGSSIWVVAWRQTIDLGTAGRAVTPAPVALALVNDTVEVPGEPNPDQVEIVVPVP